VRKVDDFRISSEYSATTKSIAEELMQTWKMTIQVGKTWNGMDAQHDLVDGVVRISILPIDYGRRHLELSYSSHHHATMKQVSFRTRNSLAGFGGLIEMADRMYYKPSLIRQLINESSDKTDTSLDLEIYSDSEYFAGEPT
jgi:hypothetical protein